MLIDLIVHNLYLVRLVRKIQLHLLLVHVLLLPLPEELVESLLLDLLNITVEALWNYDVAQVRDQIGVNPYRLDQTCVRGAKHIDDLDTIRLDVKSASILAKVKQNLKTLLIHESLSKQLAQLLVFLVDYDKFDQLQQLKMQTRTGLRLRYRARDAVQNDK